MLAMLQLQKTLLHRAVEHREQRLPVLHCVQQDDGFFMNRQLRPAENFAQFIQRSKAAGQRDKRIRQLRHHVLAFVHAANNMQLGQASMRHLAVSQLLRNDSDNFPARSEYCVCNDAHQAHMRPAIDQPEASLRHFGTQFRCNRSILCARTNSGPTIDANCF